MMGAEASRTFKDSSFSRGSSCKRSPRVLRTFRILPSPPRFRNPRWWDPSRGRRIIASRSVPFPTGESLVLVGVNQRWGVGANVRRS